MSNKNFYEVKKIHSHKVINGILKFEIEWVGYKEKSFEPISSLENCYYFLEYVSSNKLYDLYDELIIYHPNVIKKIAN